MITVYLLFIFSVIFIRILAPYDSRHEKGRAFTIGNRFFSTALLDSTSVFSKTKRLKKDQNRISLRGIVLYAFAATVLILNVTLFALPDIKSEAWGIVTEKVEIYTTTLNDRLSVISVFLLFLAVTFCFTFSLIRSAKGAEPKWIRYFIYFVGALMLLTTVALSVYFIIQLWRCFL